MAKADLKVTIDAEAAKLEREIDRTARSMQRMESQIRRTELQAARLNKELDDRRARAVENFGRGLLAFGAATAAGLGLAVKAAIDWESAWAGVLKTVEGSPEQLARVEEGLRELATTLPATHGEIAAVAEAAGQLGIATDQVVDFTRVMVMLGETTNLSATEAATALARMMNIMGTAPTDVDRLGAAIVDLGNNAATTEAEIVEMALRIAGAGATIGLSEQDVLAFATALSSVGIRAEAGGTAISRVMIEIANSVASGGESLDQFATVAGMSANEFARAFERDPAAAIQTFIAGLGEIDTAGGNVFETLDQLALGDIRVRDALLRMASASGLLTENLDRSADAWENNTALIEEAERRFDTTEAKIQLAKNTLVDLGIDIGSVLLPAIAGLAEGAADIFRWFSDLPGPVKTVFTILGTVASAASLAGAAFLLLAPRLAAARAELQLLSTTRAGPAIRGAGVALKALGIAGAVAAGLILVKQAMEGIAGTSDAVKVGVGEATAELLKLRDGIESDLVGTVVNAKGILEDSFNIDVFGTQIGNDLQELNRASNDLESGMQQIDAALGGMVAGGNVDLAADLFRQVAAAWEAGGHDVEELRERLPGYRDALADVDNQQKLTQESAEQIDQGLVDLATRFGLTGEDAEKAAQEMLDAWAGTSTEFIDILGAYDTALGAKEEAERETAQATADATEDQSDSWEDYIGDVTLSIDEYLTELQRQVEAQQNWQENMLTLAGRVSAGTLDELAKLGPEGAPLVQELVDASDEELARFEELMGARSEAGAQNFAQRLAEAEPVLKQIARDEGQEVADSIAAGMAANSSTVFEEAKRQGVRIDRGVGTNRTRDVPIGPFLEGNNMDSVRRGLNNLTLPRSVTITANLVSGSIGNLFAGRPGIHSGGEITPTGIRRFHSGGMAHDEMLAVLQTGERVLNRAQNEAWETLTAMGQRTPVTPIGGSGSQTVHLRISGDGAIFEQVTYGVRTGQLRLTANGAAVRVG